MNHKQITVVWLYNGRCKRRLRKRYVWFQSFDEVERKKVYFIPCLRVYGTKEMHFSIIFELPMSPLMSESNSTRTSCQASLIVFLLFYLTRNLTPQHRSSYHTCNNISISIRVSSNAELNLRVPKPV